MQRRQTVLAQGQGQEKAVIREQGLNVTQFPDVCMNSARAGAADGCMDLHTVAAHKNEQYRARARQGEWRVKTSRPTTRAEEAGGEGPGTLKSGGCRLPTTGESINTRPSSAGHNITNDRYGRSTSNPHTDGNLTHPDSLDRPLEIVARAKFTKHQAAYSNKNSTSFITVPGLAST